MNIEDDCVMWFKNPWDVNDPIVSYVWEELYAELVNQIPVVTMTDMEDSIKKNIPLVASVIWTKDSTTWNFTLGGFRFKSPEDKLMFLLSYR